MTCDCGREMVPIEEKKGAKYQRYICPVFDEAFDPNLDVNQHPMKFERAER